tara:strand:+ start:471 stop:590 length:120 start_codon:yes stop_codon:yes gene_type:complete
MLFPFFLIIPYYPGLFWNATLGSIERISIDPRAKLERVS